jgi:hypothetical protein
MKFKYTDPYKDVPEEQVCKASPRISLVDYQYLRNLVPGRGAIQNTMASLVNKTCHELRKYNIHDFTDADVFMYVIGELCDLDRPEFGDLIRHLITEYRVRADSPPSLVGKWPSAPVSEAASRDVDGGAVPLSDGDQGETLESADAPSCTGKRGGDGGHGSGAKAGKAKRVGKAKRAKG